MLHLQKTGISVIERRDWGIALGLALCAFSATTALAFSWSRLGTFSQYDVIFDADAGYMRSAFGNGWMRGTFNHPLVNYWFTIPIRAIQAFASVLGIVHEKQAFRETLALFVCPLFAALKAFCLYLSFRLLRLTVVQALLVTFFSLAAFGSLVFGATPESYGVTGGALALLTLLSVLLYKAEGWGAIAAMTVAGLFAVGTTSSNVIHLGCTAWARRGSSRKGPLAALGAAALLALCVIAVVVPIGAALQRSEPGSETGTIQIGPGASFLKHYTRSGAEQLENVARLPEYLARAFVPTMPERMDNEVALQNHDPIQFEYTYNNGGSTAVRIVLGLLSAVIFGGGAVIAFRNGGIWRWIGLGSAASLLGLGVLFTVVGLNTFLYVQSWQVQATMLLAAWFCYEPLKTRAALGAIAFAAALLMAGDLYVLHTMTAQMAATVHRT